jgi:HK97 family phage portal protein
MNILTLFDRTIGRFFTGGFSRSAGIQQRGPLSVASTKQQAMATDERAMQISAVWGCHSLIVDAVAMVPMNLCQKNRDGTVAEVHDHPSVYLLNRSPNAYMSPFDYRTAVTFNLVGHGNGYSEIFRDSNGELLALYPFVSSDITQKIDKGQVRYEVNNEANRIIPAEWMLHLKSFGYTGHTGLSTFEFARRLLGLSTSIQDHGDKFFNNGARPSGTFIIDKVLTEKQREAVRENFIKKLEGEDNAFKTLLLEAGMRYEKMGYSPDDMQFVDQMKMTGEDICRFWRVPPHMLGYSVAPQGLNGIEAINTAFLTYTLLPWLRRWEAAGTRQLLSVDDKSKGLFFCHDPHELYTADIRAKADYYSKMVQNGIMNRNEARQKENRPKYEGGDKFTVQSNLMPVDMLGKQAPTQTPSKEDPDGTQDAIRQ